ncbi:MAG: exopolysaccharide biosynthesis protein [Alphaproteobacteria bacterium]|nr:exopolysaccharide biosynthesis protein [Alphaproteobacteria bacterium]
MSDDDTSISAMIGRVQKAASGERTRVGDIAEALGRDSLPPNLMIPALAVVSPLSGIPLFSSICGIMIALISAQMLLRREQAWLPGFVTRKEVSTERLRKGAEWMQRPARFLDRITRRRLSWLVRRPMLWVTQLICLCCGLMMPMLEILPFTSSLMGVVVSLFAFGMLARDGLFTVFGFGAIGGVGAAVLYFVQ